VQVTFVLDSVLQVVSDVVVWLVEVEVSHVVMQSVV
jgi:hypothetical protein